MNKKIRQLTTVMFFVMVFLCQGIYLYAYKHHSLQDISLYFGKVILLFLVPLLIIFGFYFVARQFAFVKRKK